jgi:hypothetical protein
MIFYCDVEALKVFGNIAATLYCIRHTRNGIKGTVQRDGSGRN